MVSPSDKNLSQKLLYTPRTDIFLVGENIQQKWEVQRPQVVPLVENSDLPIRKILRILLALLTVMVLQKVSEIIFFKSNKFTAYKVKDGKDVTKSLMVLNLLKLYIHFKIRSIKGPRKT